MYPSALIQFSTLYLHSSLAADRSPICQLPHAERRRHRNCHNQDAHIAPDTRPSASSKFAGVDPEACVTSIRGCRLSRNVRLQER
uniref:Uncharacterized protein n=1 Tax=Arundo donax TaxID=35708 RepID=A0A0A9CMP9_ARUDO